MNKVKIPKEFECMGNTITVGYNNNLNDKHRCVGVFDRSNSKIELQGSVDGCRLSEDNINTSFYHELVHCFIASLRIDGLLFNSDSIYTEEMFCDQFGQLLLQFEKN